MYKWQYDVPMAIFIEQTSEALQEHWEELALNKDIIKLAPDVDKAEALQKAGILKNVLVLDDDGEVVGYSVVLVQTHLHYKHDLHAYVDLIYVRKQYRQATVGARLLLLTEQIAKDAGAVVIAHHAKPHVPFIIKPLLKLGYTVYEEIYGKRIV